MLALSAPQVERDHGTWHNASQCHAHNACEMLLTEPEGQCQERLAWFPESTTEWANIVFANPAPTHEVKIRCLPRTRNSMPRTVHCHLLCALCVVLHSVHYHVHALCYAPCTLCRLSAQPGANPRCLATLLQVEVHYQLVAHALDTGRHSFSLRLTLHEQLYALDVTEFIRNEEERSRHVRLRGLTANATELYLVRTRPV